MTYRGPFNINHSIIPCLYSGIDIYIFPLWLFHLFACTKLTERANCLIYHQCTVIFLYWTKIYFETLAQIVSCNTAIQTYLK